MDEQMIGSEHQAPGLRLDYDFPGCRHRVRERLFDPNLIRNFNEIQGCRVACVCDRKSGRRQYVKTRFPGIPVTDDLNQVLAAEEVDVVVVATPVSTHREIALAALEAGKPGIGAQTSSVDVIWDLATHDLSISYYLWERKPAEVSAYGYRYQHPKLIDTAFIHLHFEDGSAAIHHVSWLCPQKTRRYFLAGKRGSLLFDDTREDRMLCFIDQGLDSRIGAKDDEVKELYYKPGKVSYPSLKRVQPLRAACENFLNCIRKSEKLRSDGHAGLAVVEMLEAAELSIAEGSKPIHLTD
ncbi:Inositol 2-dehydrogenase/D-chiro-inositol 3-dehydrogenase [subsurface metagenome]